VKIVKQHRAHVDEENPYWITFSDLMSGLLVIFILAAVALIIQLTLLQNRIKSELQDAEEAVRLITHEMQSELAKNDITVELDDNDTVLRIPHSTLTFKSDSDDIPLDEGMRGSLLKIGQVMHRAINKPFKTLSDSTRVMRFQYLDTVFIEGHTDSWPSKRDGGNWGLSADRAISVWEYWGGEITEMPLFGDMENFQGRKLFSVSGYAETRPEVYKEENSEDRSKNRRIDIRFTVKKPKSTDDLLK